ncbi:signal transduction histidine kinase [Methylophilaceae bacterium 11]|jgi:signal transduction histidine kinase|uniref:sensor histidine kinase n=1 Tax=Methylotenera sp. N17 TaxID=1502761 RepID=UPI0004461952|nr:sensor histidine kinase [Methylotenera sp. N17]EUJ11621.1 signal transduction histidine kinase [Methylophilaceae bacterium 11]
MSKALSIKQLLLLAFLLAGLLPAMLVSFLSFSQASNALRKEILRDLQTSGATVATDVDRVMFERLQNVHSWSQLALMQEVLIGDVDKRLSVFLSESQKSYHQEYRALHVLDLQYHTIASSRAAQIGRTLSRPPFWFSVSVGGRQLQLSKITQNILMMTQTIQDSSTQQPIGYLVAEFNWSIVTKLLNDAVNQQAAAALLDDQNQVLAASVHWSEKRHSLHVSNAVQGKVGLPGWHVHIERARSVAVAPVHRLAYVFLALLAATLLFSLLLVRPIGRAIIQPLENLTRFVRGFHQHAQALPPKAGPPELQELAQAFEKLIQDLETSQDNLTRAAKLAVVGEMAAAMSHEVRTPLGILRSSADVLLREPKLSADGHEVLGFIISETERLNKLVSTLIDAARPRTPHFNPLDLTQLIYRVMALLQSQALAKKITMRFAQTEVMQVWADQDQMTQVLMNLLMNAIQILPAQGQIALRLERLNANMVLTVSDNGPGIQVGDQAQVFEPFFTQRAGGVGLGLAVVRQIVHAHRGEISYRNSEMGGAEFTIVLPTVQPASSNESEVK